MTFTKCHFGNYFGGKAMKKCILALMIFAVVIFACGCGGQKSSVNEKEKQDSNAETESTTKTVSEIDMGNVESVFYFGENDIFIGYAEKKYFLFESSGRIIKRFGDDVLLSYFDDGRYFCDGIGSAMINHEQCVIDYEGNNITSKYISGSDRLCNITIMDDKPVIIAVVNSNTATTSDSSLVLYNKDKSVKFSISLSQLSEKEKEMDYHYFPKMKVRNLGEGMLLLSYSSKWYILNTQTSEIFMVNYGDSNVAWSDYHNGYASYRMGNDRGLINKSGKIILDSSSAYPLDCTYSHGVYFNFADKKFYDRTGTAVIDLSEYNVVVPTANNHTAEDMLNWYVFDEAGYCTIKVKNPSGVEYQGIIDINGNWIVELSEQSANYMGKIDEQTILIGRAKTLSDNTTAVWSEVIDIKSGAITYADNGFTISGTEQFYQNKCYFVENGNVKTVDLKTGETNTIKFYESTVDNNSISSAENKKVNIDTWFDKEGLKVASQGDFILNTDDHHGTTEAFPCSAVVTSISNGDGTVTSTFLFTLDAAKTNRAFRFSACVVDRYTGKVLKGSEKESGENLEIDGKTYQISIDEDFKTEGTTAILKYNVTYSAGYDGLLYYVGYSDNDIADKQKELSGKISHMTEEPFWGTEGYWFSVDNK